MTSDLRDALLEPGEWPTLMVGPVGTGKSCAAACLFASWVGRPMWIHTGKFLNAAMAARSSEVKSGLAWNRWGVCWELSDHQRSVLERTGGRPTMSEEGAFYLVEKCDLVVFDDIGVREPTSSKRELLISLLDSTRGCVLSTSNLPPADLERAFDDRTESRLTGGRVLTVVGKDRRKANQIIRQFS